jgi:hypothetical protein
MAKQQTSPCVAGPARPNVSLLDITAVHVNRCQ